MRLALGLKEFVGKRIKIILKENHNKVNIKVGWLRSFDDKFLYLIGDTGGKFAVSKDYIFRLKEIKTDKRIQCSVCHFFNYYNTVKPIRCKCCRMPLKEDIYAE